MKEEDSKNFISRKKKNRKRKRKNLVCVMLKSLKLAWEGLALLWMEDNTSLMGFGMLYYLSMEFFGWSGTLPYCTTA